MFKKDLQDTPFKKGRKGIIKEALEKYEILKDKYQELIPDLEICNFIKDKYGLLGVEGNTYLLLGKKKPYGNIISIHTDLWEKAKRENKKIIIFIQVSGYFYQFDPSLITETKINKRGDVSMTNFNISYCANLEKLAEIMALKKKKNDNIKTDNSNNSNTGNLF